MPTLLNSVALYELVSSVLWIVVDSGVKATILLTMAIVATWVLRRDSAAIRDRIWTLAFCGSVVLPLVSCEMPQWRIALTGPQGPTSLVARNDAIKGASADADQVGGLFSEEQKLLRRRTESNYDATLPVDARIVDTASSRRTSLSEVRRESEASSGERIPLVGQIQRLLSTVGSQFTIVSRYSQELAVIWVTGFVLSLVPFTMSVIATWIVLVNGRKLNEPAARQLVDRLAVRLGLARHVALLQVDQNMVPLTFGILRPAVVIPANWRSWPIDRMRFVLLHELSHVKRFDVLFQSVARLVCAIYWFNPLAWYAFHRMRLDCEMACDDGVIATGERASEYADQLIEIARTYRPVHFSAGVAMARSSKLEDRIVSLLDGSRARASLGIRAGRSLLLFASVLVLLLSAISIDNSQVAAVEVVKEETASGKDIRQVALAADKAESKLEKGRAAPDQKIGKNDWPQWGGTSQRNNVSNAENIPARWNLQTGENILWAARVGSQTFGTPVVANGKVFVGTNNSGGYVQRFPATTDLGVLLALDEKTGQFLWQASSPKLNTGRVHDWPHFGVTSTPYCDDSRVWYVTNRGEVTCLDAEGFRDGVNNGPYKSEPNENLDEADIIWSYDMMTELGVSQHNKSPCSVTCVGDRCFVITGNAADERFGDPPAPNAASFIALDKNTGKLLWSDRSPGQNIIVSQWSSPCVFEAGGREQVVMGGGDGWIYSFDPAGDGKGGGKLLWKFDGNPKESFYTVAGRSTRNSIVGIPVFYDGFVYFSVGRDPSQGEGIGHLYCVDPTKNGDISLELAVDLNGDEIEQRRIQAVDPNRSERAIPNPNAAAVWHFDTVDRNADGKDDFEETMHRMSGSVVIKNDLLFAADFAGLVHCLDAKKSVNGKPVVHWTHDMMSAVWGSGLIAGDQAYFVDEDGDVTVLALSDKKNVLGETNLASSAYATPIVANDVLYASSKDMLFAIKANTKLEGGVKVPAKTAAAPSGK